MQTKNGLSHFNELGQAHMVDVGTKTETDRTARACGNIIMQDSTLAIICAGNSKKGDVLAIATVAAIQGAKRTSDLIPLCHPISLSHINVTFDIQEQPAMIHCLVTAKCLGRTGVEMEALCATSIALLTIYDMCKAIDRGMRIENIRLLEKSGGKSGHWFSSK